MSFISWLGNIRRGAEARRAAERLCAALFPGEPRHGSWVCADEPERFVVRVFCGDRAGSPARLPPWRECVVVAVDKATLTAERVADDGPYRPLPR